MQFVLPHPEIAPDVVDEKVPLPLRVPRGDVIALTQYAGGGIIVALVSQRVADRLGEAALIGADVGTAFIYKRLVDHLQTSRAALLHAAAHGFGDLVCADGGHRDAVDTVFLEEHRVALKVHRSGPRPVRTYRRRPAVGRYARVLPPVFEVAQSTAVDLVEIFPVRQSVTAAPEAVFALDDEVHLRCPPLDVHRALCLGDGRVEDTRHDDIIVFPFTAPDGADHMVAVDRFHRRTPDAHAVVFPEQVFYFPLGDKAQTGIDRGDLCPLAHGCAPLAQNAQAL